MTQKTTSSTQEAPCWKIENFTLHLEGENRWKVSGRDLDGVYRRLRFRANDKREAVRTAKQLLRKPAFHQLGEFPVLPIADALIKASRERNWNPAHRKNDELNCAMFLRWVDEKGLRYWHELRFEHVEEYRSCLLKRNLAYDTVRLYLWPIRRTARWMASNWPHGYTNFCEHLRLSRRHSEPTLYSENRGNPVLAWNELLDLLAWVSRRPRWRKLTVSIALQGLMGLRMQEALRLTWEKINWMDETLIVDDQVKNAFSVRCLPLPQLVLWLLRCAWETSSPSGLQARVLPGYQDYREYSGMVRKILDTWNPNGTLKPKDLRNTLPSAAYSDGWHSVYVERYLGHCPKSITERHYLGDQGKRLVELYRQKVVPPIDAAVEAWMQSQGVTDGPIPLRSAGLEIGSAALHELHDWGFSEGLGQTTDGFGLTKKPDKSGS